MSKSGMSVGCIVAGVIGAFFLVAVVGLVGFLGFTYYYSNRSVPASGPPSVPGDGKTVSPTGGSSSTAERPDPTPEQLAALSDAKTIEWESQGMSWRVPSKWNTQQDVEQIFSVKSPGSFDAGWLTVTVSPLPDSMPTEVSLNAMYQQALDQQKLGKYTEVRWLELDGVRGIQWREAAPADSGDVQRIQWQAYRNYNGQKQLINLMVHSSGKGFPEHVDALYAILYTTTVTK